MQELIQQFLNALSNKDANTAQQLLDKHPDLADAKNADGVSLIFLAAYHQQAALALQMTFVKKHWDAFEAAAFGKAELLEQLIDQDKALLSANSPDGFPLLALAAYFGQEKIVELLLSKGAGPNQKASNPMQIAPIHAAVAIQNIPIAKLLLEHQADVNQAQMEGIRPIHSAVHRANKELTELLIQHGADVELKTDDGRTALDIAVQEGHEELKGVLERGKEEKKVKK